MIITLKNANFSENNVGQLNSWFIFAPTVSGGVVTADSNNPSSIDKTTLPATILKYTFDTAKYNFISCTPSVGIATHSNGLITVTIPKGTAIVANITISIVLERIGGEEEEETTNYTFTINPDPTSATVTLSATGYSTVSGTGSKSITVANGTTVSWSVSASGYTTRTGSWTISGGNKTENITLNASGGEGATTWYLDHTNQPNSFASSVNIAGRGWTHKPGTAGYNAYVGKPVNTIGFFTTLASQNITIGKVAEKGGESDMTVIATVTATNPTGTTKGFCSVTFPTVTLNSGECLVIYAQTDATINFYYNSNASVTDANGVVDGNFYGRVPKVYGSGTAWTAYTEKICLGISVGYNSDVA